MPTYTFKVDDPSVPSVTEEFANDAAAKRHACIVADEINRGVEYPCRVLVLDEDGNLLAAVDPIGR